MKTMRVENSSFIVDEGKHQAELVEVIESESKYGPALKLMFRILDVTPENGNEPPVISGMCSSKRLTPSTKLFQWLSVLKGGALDIGEEIDPEQFVGYTVELKVENSKKEDGSEFSNVAKLLKVLTPF